MSHVSVRTTFKAHPLNGVFGTVLQTIGHSNVNFQKILPYLYDALRRYSFALVRSNVFTLVNIASPRHGKSFGYSEIEFGDYAENNVLMLTFALVPVPLKKLTVTEKYISLRSHDFVWGREGKGAEYLTIVLDRDQFNTMISGAITSKVLQSLYNAIGACTKSFVKNVAFESIVDSFADSLMFSRYYLKSISVLMRDDPITYWRFNKYMWQTMPGLVLRDSFSDDFYVYFTRHILPVVESTNLILAATLFQRNGNYHTFIQDGMRSLLSAWNAKHIRVSLTPRERSALSLLIFAFDDDEFDHTDEALLIAYNHVNHLLQQDRMKALRFVGLFSNIEASTYNLIINSDYFQAEVKETLLETDY